MLARPRTAVVSGCIALLQAGLFLLQMVLVSSFLGEGPLAGFVPDDPGIWLWGLEVAGLLVVPVLAFLLGIRSGRTVAELDDLLGLLTAFAVGSAGGFVLGYGLFGVYALATGGPVGDALAGAAMGVVAFAGVVLQGVATFTGAGGVGTLVGYGLSGRGRRPRDTPAAVETSTDPE